MRRLAASMVLALAAGLLIGAGPADAATLGAADLEADCNADGQLVISKPTHYHGGTALLTQDCFVQIADGINLTLTKVTIASKCCGFIVNTSGNDSSVFVLDSNTDLIGNLQLTAGCCSGDPGEEDGTVRILRSNLLAATIDIEASVGSPNGLVWIRDSRLEATSATSFRPISLLASYGAFGDATAGTVYLTKSDVISPGNVDLRTGPNGDTTAISNVFTAGGTITITTGTGGTCTSRDNSPDVPCT